MQGEAIQNLTLKVIGFIAFACNAKTLQLSFWFLSSPFPSDHCF